MFFNSFLFFSYQNFLKEKEYLSFNVVKVAKFSQPSNRTQDNWTKHSLVKPYNYRIFQQKGIGKLMKEQKIFF